jgi:hypothetical protein
LSLARQGRERPLRLLPRWLLAAFLLLLAAQVGWQAMQPRRAPLAEELPPPPTTEALRLAALGEPAALARVAMVWLQAFDAAGENALPYQRLDYGRLTGWLRAILELDPRSDYPLFSAARVYAETADPARQRRMLDFIAEEFARDPNRRWLSLAHATLLAKHRLGDLPLARRYAAAIEQRVTDPAVPLWARQMEVFILEDMNELEAAKVMLGGMLATGRIVDPEEQRFLEGRLKALEERIKAQGPKR